MPDLRRLLAFAAPYRAPLAFAGALMLLETAASLAIPWLGGRLAEALLQPGAPTEVAVPVVLIGMLLLFAVQAILNLGMLPAIKTFTREPQESLRHRGQVDVILRLSLQQLRTQAALGPAVQFIAAAGIVLLLWLASGEIAGGALTPAALVSFLLYAQLLTRPVAGLADVYGQTQSVRGSLTRLLAALDEPTEAPAHVGTTMPPVKGAIAFEAVSFSYPGRPPALQQFDLQIAAGKTVAVTGPNGAGKSTLAHLLMRLHHPSAGRILIDGIDIATVSLHSLRSQIGVVPQHVLLFNATVRDNIAYGRPEPTQQDVEAAARAARAHDFIVALPQGYDTPIGDRGVRLSGGQQQRVAHARALLKNPPILILDEATAMFDPQARPNFSKPPAKPSTDAP